MYNQYISFNETNTKLNICNDDFNIIETYSLGECIMSFLEFDFSQYSSFYNDLHNVLISNLGDKQNRFEDLVIPSALEKKLIDDFFIKYPKLKEYIYKNEYTFFNDVYKEHNEDDDHKLIELAETTDVPDEKELFYSLTKESNIKRMVNNKIYNRAEFNSFSWDFIFNTDCPNEYISNIDEIRYHPFVQLAYDDISDESALSFHTSFHFLKDIFLEPFIFCFDIDFNPLLNKLTALERFYLYNKLYPNSRLSYEGTNISFSVKNDSDFNLSEINTINDDTVALIKRQKIIQVQLYETVKINNMLYIEFNKMLEMNIKIMKCKNCGKYFILKGGYNTKYCDRIPEGENNTCQKIAASKKMKEKIDSSPILKEYQRAYKRKYAQVSNRKLGNEEFRLWVEDATQRRNAATDQYKTNQCKQIVEDFIKYLGNK